MKLLTYDIEIAKAILGKNETPDPDIEYVSTEGFKSAWDNQADMGISVLCAHSEWDGNVHVIMEDNLDRFNGLVNEADKVVGWNNWKFDDPLVETTWGIRIPEEKKLDWLVTAWAAHGLGPKFEYPSHMGHGLDDYAFTNFGVRKLQNGADAPKLWQRGELGELISYCINDVQLTVRLGALMRSEVGALSPKKRDVRVRYEAA